MLHYRTPRLLAAALIAALLPAAAKAQYVFRPVNDPAAVGNSQASGLDNAGRIVGYSGTAAGLNNSYVATPAGNGFTFAGYTAPNVDSTFLNDINNNGRLVGSVSISGSFFGFLGRVGNQTVTPLNFGNGGLTFAYGVNDVGSAAGTYSSVVGSNPGTIVVRGFVTHDDGQTFAPLQAPQADNLTRAFGIGPVGTVVGDYRDAGAVFHGFVATPGPGGAYAYATVDVPGATRTTIRSVNALDVLAGNYDPVGGQPRGFVATRVGAGYSFEDIVHPAAVNGTFALGINDAGAVVGYYVDAGFVNRGFVATPIPEPSSLALAALGVLGTYYRRRIGGCF